MNFRLNIIFIFLIISPFSVNGQDNQIIVETNEFNNLIGVEFSDISELGDFIQTSSSSITRDGIEKRSTRLISESYTIYTSEIVTADSITGIKIRKILDLIILSGNYGSCEGCLKTNRTNITIKSIHPVGSISKDNIIAAFERDEATGKYNEVNPKRFIWNRKKNN